MHPRMILTKPLIDLPIRAGIICLYVSVVLKCTLRALCPCSHCANKLGISIYESGPATKSTPCSLIKVSPKRSAIHPITPIIIFRPAFTTSEWLCMDLAFNSRNRADTFCSALSLIEQVLRIIISACSHLSVICASVVCMIAATTSLSATFIWQP